MEADQDHAASDASESRIGPLGLIAGALGIGLVTGWAEAAWHALRPMLGLPVLVEAMRVNRHVAWMAPLSAGVALLAAGVLLAPLTRWRRGRLAAYSLLAMLAAASLLEWMPRLHPVARVVLACGVGLRLGSWALSREAALRGMIRWGTPLAVAASLIGGALADRQIRSAEARALAARTAAPASPNLLLIVLDTVRADHLNLYGYNRDTTPNLARLAARGVTFAHARSTAPWTLPSHASMLTGRWPHELAADEDHAMTRSVPTLAEALAAKGYATGGFVANTWYCNAAFGLDRGFARYEDCDPNRRISASEVAASSMIGRRAAGLAARLGLCATVEGVGDKPASRVTDDALAWIDGVKDRPFFAFLNYFDAHAPYLLPDGVPHRKFGLLPATPEEQKLLRGWHDGDKKNVTPRQAQLALDGYDECLAYLDQHVGRLIDELERRGKLKETVVVITSDHGEEFGEHNLYGHGRSLYSQELHVPLIVFGPGVPSGRTVERPVTLRDLAATSADLLGQGGTVSFPGRSLAIEWSGRPAPSAPILSEVAHRAKTRKAKNRPPAWLGPMSSVLVDGLNYIRRADGAEEVYDVVADPADARDLAARGLPSGSLEALRVALKRAVAGEDGPIAPETAGRPAVEGRARR